jgi:hypothetical protein
LLRYRGRFFFTPSYLTDVVSPPAPEETISHADRQKALAIGAAIAVGVFVATFTLLSALNPDHNIDREAYRDVGVMERYLAGPEDAVDFIASKVRFFADRMNQPGVSAATRRAAKKVLLDAADPPKWQRRHPKVRAACLDAAAEIR